MGLIYGLAALLIIWWGAKMFAGSNPVLLAAALKKAGGVASLLLAGFFMLRGRIDMAMLVGGFGAWLLGWAFSHPFAQWVRGNRPPDSMTPGKVTRVASRFIEMELDHDSGDMHGRVLDGRLKDRQLGDLDASGLEALMAELESVDADGARLLDAYLDRRFAGRRQDRQADRDAGAPGPGNSGAMSKQEAYELLGLEPGASGEAVRQAHRTLMKRIHPDAGGTAALAARVNEAKDVLLK